MNHEPHERVLFADEVFAIQGAIFEVNRHMERAFWKRSTKRVAPKARIERLVL